MQISKTYLNALSNTCKSTGFRPVPSKAYFWRFLRKNLTTCWLTQTFFTILRVSFCVTRNAFNLIDIKNKNVVAQFSKSSIRLRRPFKNLMGLLDPFASYKNIYHFHGSIVIFYGCWIKIFFTIISSCITVLNLEKIWRARYSYLISCSWLGIVMNLYLYEDKYFVNYF